MTVIRPDAILEAVGQVADRMGSLPGKDEWFATMERAGVVPMFNDVEEWRRPPDFLRAIRFFAMQQNRKGCDL